MFLDPLPDASKWDTYIANLTAWRNTTLTALNYTLTNPSNVYTIPSLLWSQSTVFMHHVMSYDQRLLSSVSPFNNYTVDNYLSDIRQQLGGRLPDIIVLWITIPTLGIDNRNQFDWYKSLPSTVSSYNSNTNNNNNNAWISLTNLVDAFHSNSFASIPVLLAYSPDDDGTDGSTVPDSNNNKNDYLLEIMYNCSIDGLYIMNNGNITSSLYFINITGTPTYFAIAGEGSLPDTSSSPSSIFPLTYQPFSRISHVPTVAEYNPPQLGISTNRWFERRHISFMGSHWITSGLTTAIQTAFINGGGISTTSNSYGFSNPMVPRESALLTRVYDILHFIVPLLRNIPGYTKEKKKNDKNNIFTDPLPDNLPLLSWLPLFPSNTSTTIIGSQFTAPCPAWQQQVSNDTDLSHQAGAGGNCTVWLFANTGTVDIFNTNINISLGFINGNSSMLYFYDLYQGTTVNFTAAADDTVTTSFSSSSFTYPNANVTGTTLSLNIEAGGIAAILATPPTPPPPQLTAFLASIANVTAKPLSNYSNEWNPVSQTISPLGPTTGSGSLPPNMVLIPGMAGYYFNVKPVWPDFYNQDPDAINTLQNYGVDVQYPWETIPSPNHSAVFTVFPFYIDTTFVTNADYYEFIQSTGYNTTSFGIDPVNFLQHWVTYPNSTGFSYNISAGDANRPVTWISRTDAATYCKWRGKRLPTEWELQFAGQTIGGTGGTDYRIYPWGNTTCESTTEACPAIDNSTQPRSPDTVLSHPNGGSFLGVQDLVGNVWHITDTYCDKYSCGIVLKGGSLYRPYSRSLLQRNANPYSIYIPQALALNTHVKLPYMDDSSIRSGYVGFRCMVESVSTKNNAQTEYGTFQLERYA